MEHFKVIEYHVVRDFSKKINVTFEFIRQNFKPLMKSIFLIAAPCAIVGSLFGGSLVSDLMNQAINPDRDAYFESMLSVTFFLRIGLMIIFYLLSGMMSIATIYSYIILYGEKRTNQIEVQEVWESVRNNFWMYLGSMFLFVVLTLGVLGIAAIPAVLLFSLGTAGIVLMFFYGFIVGIGGFTYLLVASSFTFIIRAYENKGFFDALFRSFRLVNGKWWSTFGLIFILNLIVSTIASLLMIPFNIITAISTVHSLDSGTPGEVGENMAIFMMIFITISHTIQLLMNALPHVGVAFQYFNLVERKESKGLMQSIETLGQAPKPMDISFLENPSDENNKY